MAKKTIFRAEFLVAGIMCYRGCGVGINTSLQDLNEELKQGQPPLLPQDAELIVDAEPQGLGLQRLIILIQSDEKESVNSSLLRQKFKDKISKDAGFPIVDEEEIKAQNNAVNWLNIGLNLAAIAVIITLSILFPPSLPLTIGLTVFSFAITAITARHHLWHFVTNLRRKQLTTMSTPITLGWLLSLTHTLYHGIMMPMMRGFSTVFMNYLMPVMLITFINGLDEIKRLVLNKSRKMQVQGMQSLFPQMAESYPYFPDFVVTEELDDEEELTRHLQQRLAEEEAGIPETIAKSAIKKRMLLRVKRGECFPVDGIILQNSTFVDASLLTGEPSQAMHAGQRVPAGAINLGQDVLLYALENCYGSTINQILFRANRAVTDEKKANSERNFSYWYGALIAISMVAAVAVPAVVKIVTFSLVLQNITGILFAVCPCTITIAHQLPKLFSLHQRQKKGVILRNEQLLDRSGTIETLVFDKTGTLTTGNSQVCISEGISPEMWQRVYLLEKDQGGQHPLAQAIMRHYKEKYKTTSLIDIISDPQVDSKNRGLSACVQGVTMTLGNRDYLQACGVNIPDDAIPQAELDKGHTPIYVAENNQYAGYILVQHEIRPGILQALTRLKQQGINLIMLTGDSDSAALGLNRQLGEIFTAVHAQQTPQDKEKFLSDLMQSPQVNAKGVWFIGDGINDAPCAKRTTELGGVSCSISSDDKSAYFSDISLNGEIDYLFHHSSLNRTVRKNIRQNQALLAYSAVLFLTFIVSFAVAGIAVSPLIPLVIMLATTGLVLFNCYRAKLAVDTVMDNKVSWPKKYFASDLSLGLLVTSFSLVIAALLIATLATGGLALPVIAFTSGAALLISSICVLSAVVVLATFALLGTTWLVEEKAQGVMETSRPNTPIVQPSSVCEEQVAQAPRTEYVPAEDPTVVPNNMLKI